MLPFRPFQKAFAIDISDARLRVLQIEGKKGGLHVRCFNECGVPEGYIVNGEIVHHDKVVPLIRSLVSTVHGRHVSSHFVVASLPERKTFFKVFDIPLLPDAELPGAVQWGIEQNIPISFDAVTYDWQIVSKDEASQKVTVAVAVIPKEIAESYTALLIDARLQPIALETESNAIGRALLKPDDTQTAKIIVDLGASRTSVILIDDGAVYYSSTLDISGQEMTKLISQKISLTVEQAEKAKIMCGLDEKKGKGIIRRTLLPIFQPLEQKINEVSLFYTRSLQRVKPLGITFCGGASQMTGLTEYFSTQLKLPIAQADLFSRMPSLSDSHLPHTKILSFTTAIGLAMRPFYHHESFI
ncbi:MAG: type IV pilus assembly protein PilM [Patescibacteria group bacterium]|jgi:type IV pilus assembly protein PilM